MRGNCGNINQGLFRQKIWQWSSCIMYYAALGPYEKTAAFLSHFPYLALTIDASCDVISGPYLHRWHLADGKQDPVVCSLYILRVRESCCSGTASAMCGRLYESRRSIIWSEINTDKFGIALSHRLSVKINPSAFPVLWFSESPNLDFTEQSHRKRSGTFEISIVDRSAIDYSGVVVHGFRERWIILINTKSRASGRPKPLHVSILVGPLGEWVQRWVGRKALGIRNPLSMHEESL